MSDVRTRVIVEDQATKELEKIDAEFDQLGQGAAAAGAGVEDAGDDLSNFLGDAFHVMSIAGQVVDVFKNIYEAAAEGAVLIGGKAADAYEEFEVNVQSAEEQLKSFLANALLPVIQSINAEVAQEEALDLALKDGIITREQYNQAVMFGMQGLDEYTNMTEEEIRAVEANAEAHIRATTAGAGFGLELDDLIRKLDGYDRALLVTAGILESDIDAALDSQRSNLRLAQAAWSLLSQQMDGPFGASAERFAENQANLVQHIADIKEEIADLGGLEYLTPEQIDQILVLRDKLIGVSMEIHAIDEEFGEAFDAGKQGRRVLEAADTLEGLRETAWELEQQIISLGSKPYTTAAQLEKIDDLQQELKDTETAIGDLATAQEEATRRMVLSMFQQQLAVDGLTLEEVDMLNDLALAWGLIDQATYDAFETVVEAAEMANNDENFNDIRRKLGEIEGVHDVVIGITVTGAELLDAARDDLEAMLDAHQGGYVDPTQPYGPGNSGASGGVDPVDSGNNSGGGSSGDDAPGNSMPSTNLPSININLDGETIARVTSEQLGALVRQALSAGSGWAGG